MVNIRGLCVCFVLALFAINNSAVAQPANDREWAPLPRTCACCPNWGNAEILATTGCPNLYKEQRTFVSFYEPSEIYGRSNGRGQCAAFGTIQCWPGFRQPTFKETGSTASYYYRQWVATVDEKVVVFPPNEEPDCDLAGTLTFTAPEISSGSCLQAVATGCSTQPNFLGNCPIGTTNNGCNGCCSDAERNACTSWGGVWNFAGGGFCREPSSICWEQQYECMGWGQMWTEFACGCVEPCAPTSPIIVDVDGDGFDLTNSYGGVVFDLNGDGTREGLSWTTTGDDDAWLVMDRNGNGLIDKGAEFFGNFTYQPSIAAGAERHGFLALAEFDKKAGFANGGYGGNGDGIINNDDAVFSSLRLWQDLNHNGVSEPGELHTLEQLGMYSIDLDYAESRQMDRYGNWFKYRAKVRDRRGTHVGRWAWDVFLIRSS